MIAHVRAPFTALVSVPNEQVDLPRAALWLARAFQPELDPEPYLQHLELMGEHAALRLTGCTSPTSRIAALNEYLFEVEGFVGNTDSYYDPRNSFLNEVLDRKTGIPISLSLVYMEVGRRAGVTIEGIGLPGHFLVRHTTSTGDLYIDPFHQGQFLTLDTIEQRLRERFGPDADLEPHWLLPMSRRRILGRLLSNLRGIYLHARQTENALTTVELSLCLDPDHPDELRTRGVLSLQLECFGQAWSDFSRYLELRPDAEDRAQVEQYLLTAREMALKMN